MASSNRGRRYTFYQLILLPAMVGETIRKLTAKRKGASNGLIAWCSVMRALMASIPGKGLMPQERFPRGPDAVGYPSYLPQDMGCITTMNALDGLSTMTSGPFTPGQSHQTPHQTLKVAHPE